MNQILTIMVMSSFCENGELVKIFKRSHSEIVRIVKGYATIRDDDGTINKELIGRLGFKLCGCCRERVIVENPEPSIKLSRLCIYCFKTASSDGEHNLHLPVRYSAR